MSYLLALDQGTSSSRSIVFDGEARIVAMVQKEFTQIYPEPGWVEHNPLEIWQTQLDTARQALAQAGLKASDIRAIGITNQRETTVVWNRKTGQPVYNAIVWQDHRTEPACRQLSEQGLEHTIQASTGLRIDAYFSATKLGWILDKVPSARALARKGELAFGTIDSWLLWQLTGGAVHATDHSNASRTQLFNTKTLAWDDELGKIFGVPLSLLPEVRSSNSLFGSTRGLAGVADGIPIHAMIGDSHAALFGHGVRSSGTVKATYGTGTSLMTLTDHRTRSRHGLSSTIAWSRSSEISYALEGNISVSGQAAAFMADMLGLDDATALAALASTVPDSSVANDSPTRVITPGAAARSTWPKMIERFGSPFA